MKKTHQIGLMAALLAGIAFTTPAQDPVQSISTPASSDAAFRLSAGPESGLPTGNFSNAYDWTFGGSLRTDDLVRDLQLTPLGVRLAYSFGL
jgi:hypothetical protein